MQVKITVATNVGRVRTNNEDNFAITKPWSAQNSDILLDSRGILLMVADGMGGTNAGEVASNIATSVVKEQFEISLLPQEDEARKGFLKNLLLIAHKNIVNHAFQYQGNAGMGTTVVLAWLIDNKAYIVWCGDSRCYLFRPEMPFLQQLQLLTDDHSLVWQKVKTQELTPEQARLHPDSNIILQSLGDPSQMPKPDACMFNLQTNDQIMLCSDGLHGMLSDEQIAGVFREPTDNMCREFVKQANKAGGEDNITVITAAVQQLQTNVITTNIANLPTTELSNEIQSVQNVNKINAATTTKKKRWVWVVLPILVTLMLSAGIGYYYYANQKKEAPTIQAKHLSDTIPQTDTTTTVTNGVSFDTSDKKNNNKKDSTTDGASTKSQTKNKETTPKVIDLPTTEALKKKVQTVMEDRFNRVGKLVADKQKQCPAQSEKLEQINKNSKDKLVSLFKEKGVKFDRRTKVTKVPKDIPASVFTDAERIIAGSVEEVNKVNCPPANPPTTTPQPKQTPAKGTGGKLTPTNPSPTDKGTGGKLTPTPAKEDTSKSSKPK